MRFTKAFGMPRLMKDYGRELKTLIQDEVKLAKTELSEKVNIMKSNAISFGVGLFVAFAGIIVLSLGLGRLFALALANLGWSEDLANFVGIAATGLVVALIGLIFLLKAIKTFSSESLKPERTLETLRELRGKEEIPVTNTVEEEKEPEPAKQPTKEELEARIHHTRAEMRQTARQVGKRMAMASMAAFATRHIRRHPIRMLTLGVGAALAMRQRHKRKANGY